MTLCAWTGVVLQRLYHDGVSNRGEFRSGVGGHGPGGSTTAEADGGCWDNTHLIAPWLGVLQAAVQPLAATRPFRCIDSAAGERRRTCRGE